MKKLLLIILLLVWTASSFAAGMHLTREDGNYFGLYGQGGYSMIAPWGIGLNAVHGYEAGAGLLYEYRHQSFLLDVGLGFGYQDAGYALPQVIHLHDAEAVDSQGWTYTLQTSLTRSDQIRRGFMDLPILFGGTWGKFYFLAGPKLGLTVLDRSIKSARITTIGIYDQYFTPVHDADNHGFRNYVPVSQSARLAAQLDVRLGVELGGWITDQYANQSFRARVAVYADYGCFLRGVNQNEVVLSGNKNNYDFDTYTLEPILVQGQHALGNLMAGIKITILFKTDSPSSTSLRNCKTCRLQHDMQQRPVNQQQKCVICNSH